MARHVFSNWTHDAFGSVTFATDPAKVDDYTDRVRTAWKPDWETLLAIELLRRRPGLVVDLGANIGVFCIPVALGADVDVIAVEALPENAGALRAAVQANVGARASRIQIQQCAVSDQPGSLRFTGDSAFGTADPKGATEVAARTLDEIVGRRAGELALIKIDIEGCEMMALAGARNSLSHAPDVIIEGNGAHCLYRGYFPQDFIAIFQILGLKVYMIAGRRLVPVDRSTLQPFGLINYLATSQEVSGLERFNVGPLTEEEIAAGVETALTRMKPAYGIFMRKQDQRAGIKTPPYVRSLLEDPAAFKKP